MSVPTLVFVHGRGQEFKDPGTLRRRWLAGLNAGLTQAGSTPLGADRVVFPYYGNVLYKVTREAAGDRVRLESLGQDDPGPFHPATPADVGAVERELLADVARSAGIAVPEPDEPRTEVERRAGGSSGVRPEGLRERILSWRTARELLTLLAKRSRVDQLIIEAQLRDVAMYLTRGRESVLDVVRGALPAQGPLVLVTHSLGTVVACDLLDDDAIRARTRLWVTTGSPLGLEAVQRNLLNPGRRHPGLPWLTAFDINDVVALGHPLRRSWGDPLRDVEVENDNDPHSISRYLSHARVAGPIGAEASA